MAVLWLALAAAGFAGARYAFARFFPWRDCPRCGGARRLYGPGGHRDCGKCGATGRVRRFGAGRER